MPDGYKPAVVMREAGAVRFRDVVPKLWGDDLSGTATDLIYVSNESIQQILFELPPGARFTHSADHRTIFNADQVYHVLSGRLIIANPATGELHKVGQGEWVYLQPGTWHHGFNQSTDRLRVLEYFVPPPAKGTSQPFARSQPYLEKSSYAQSEWLGRWPMAREEARAKFTQHPISPDDFLWLGEGTDNPLLSAVVLSTSQLTVCVAELMPGQQTDALSRPGDEAGFVLDGQLSLLLPAESGGRRFELLDPDDGFYVPGGHPHRFLNGSSCPARFVFAHVPA